jgi:16S rRNA (cytosine1402-N4)-methyltransferase
MHTPVLQKELIDCLAPEKNENFVDATINGGGHARLILKRTAPKGMLLGIDWTPELINKLDEDLKQEGCRERVVLSCDNFAKLGDIVRENDFRPINGVVLDLGFSSWHIERSGHGFSFLSNEPLDMRFNDRNDLDAWTVINRWSEEEIAATIRDYGQERFWKKIASSIVADRQLTPIDTTGDLVEIIERSVPEWYRRGKLNAATKTFQALRIVVNQELSNLSQVLPQIVEVLAPGGRVAVISFHELEDRIVKQFLKSKEKEGSLALINKKVIKASPEEVIKNKRARSAKLRAARKNK